MFLLDEHLELRKDKEKKNIEGLNMLEYAGVFCLWSLSLFITAGNLLSQLEVIS